jgi:hypothetical protein
VALWQAASGALMVLAVIAAPPSEDCPSAGEAYQAAANKVIKALRDYEECIAKSHGRDKCAAEIQALDDAHDDFEDAVADYAKACP